MAVSFNSTITFKGKNCTEPYKYAFRDSEFSAGTSCDIFLIQKCIESLYYMLFEGKTFSVSPVKAFLLHMKYLKSHWLWRKNKPEQLFKYSAQGTEVEEGVLNGTFYYLEYLLINPSLHS